MKIQVKVIPNASKNEVICENDRYTVRTTVAPADGKANEKVTQLLADFLKLRKSALRLVSGKTSRHKIFEF